MFVSTKGFKKLIKESYDINGLTVGTSDEEYFFEGGELGNPGEKRTPAK